MTNNGFNYYRIKMCWKTLLDNGEIAKVKTEDLVYASSYTDAEKIAYALVENQNRTQYEEIYSIEIIKTKISEFLFTKDFARDSVLVGGLVYNYFEGIEEGVGLYAVKVMVTTIDEKSAKEKRSYQTIYTAARSNSDAANRVKGYMSQTDCVIRDVKFDAAESVLWPIEVYESLTTVA